jgi:hypothetical protein
VYGHVLSSPVGSHPLSHEDPNWIRPEFVQIWILFLCMQSWKKINIKKLTFLLLLYQLKEILGFFHPL